MIAYPQGGLPTAGSMIAYPPASASVAHVAAPADHGVGVAPPAHTPAKPSTATPAKKILVKEGVEEEDLQEEKGMLLIIVAFVNKCPKEGGLSLQLRCHMKCYSFCIA